MIGAQEDLGMVDRVHDARQARRIQHLRCLGNRRAPVERRAQQVEGLVRAALSVEAQEQRSACPQGQNVERDPGGVQLQFETRVGMFSRPYR